VVTNSHFLLSTGLYAYSPAPFVTFYPFWLQDRLEISVVTLMVGCILYVIDSLQIPILSLTLLLIMHILFPFLAQIPPLTQLYDPRPFTLAFALTLLFQILSSISKIFSALILSLLPHLAFLPFLLAFFLISWFLPYKSGHLIIFISFFS